MEDLEKIRQEYEIETLQRRRELEQIRHEAELERIQQERELSRARQKMELEKVRQGGRTSSDRTSDAMLAGMFTAIFGAFGFSLFMLLNVLFQKFCQTAQLLDIFLPIYLVSVIVVVIASVVRAWRK